ncbi:hypothetical protein [Deinococcus yavapaiensis]|uniref:Uncharacterized protein n=1 Tax=Deinococcus yavapaiensis KR-236 TaxID=694435 RepID=A0A318SGT4_9DEIO|nr:hypothetical protein [Deinococcus yavapaiensis]PYE49484.1 hypothetical protein DES52_12230 [Deinococcus yavapaiensis KR-236]
MSNASTLLKFASEDAQEGSDALAQQSKSLPRPTDEQTLCALEAESEIMVAQRVLRSALVFPRLEELMDRYGARIDDCDADLGLGPDYDVLMTAINALNPLMVSRNGTGGARVTCLT